jgi:hypothetical protein
VSPVTCHVNLSLVYLRLDFCRQIISPMALLSQLSSNVVFYEGVDVYPLTPLDHTAATFPMWGVDEHFYTGVARMLNVDKRFIYYPASFGDLPLSDASFM